MTIQPQIIPGNAETAASPSGLTPQEFSRLFTRYREPFVGIAASYLHDRAAAEDIVADCFTRLWDKRCDLQLTEKPEAYLLASIKNRCLNHLRDKAAHLRIEQKMHEDSYRALFHVASYSHTDA